MISGPGDLSDRLDGPPADGRGDEGAAGLAEWLRSALPPLFFDVEVKGLFGDLVDRIAEVIRRAGDVLALGDPPEDSWRDKLTLMAVGLAGHPADEPQPWGTTWALRDAIGRVTHRPMPSGVAGRLVAGDVWEWTEGPPGPDRREPRGGLLTGGQLTVIIAAMAPDLRRRGIHLRSVTVAEGPLEVETESPFRLGRGGGCRLGLGSRLGRSVAIRGVRVVITLSARIADDRPADGWNLFLKAVELRASRHVPQPCVAVVRVGRLTGSDAATKLGRGFRLGRGLSLAEPVDIDGDRLP